MTLTPEQQHLAAILLAVAEGRAELLHVTGWGPSISIESIAYIRDNIARFRIKPEVVDVVKQIEAWARSATQNASADIGPAENVCCWLEHARGLTALAESIRGMQG